MQMAANRLRRMLIISRGIILCGLTALPAAHFTEATATPPAPSAMNDSVSIELRGRVMPRCDFSGSDAPLTFGEARAQEEHVQIRRSFKVNCNAPFVMAMASAYGGLKLATNGSSDQLSLGYDASLTIITDRGRIVSLSCTDSDLKHGGAGCAKTSGDDTAIGKEALLTIDLRTEKHLISGSYSEELYLKFHVQD